MPKAGYASLVGRPNAGKSTLLNRIIGEKIAIVSDKPQTTRNRIVAVKNYPGGQIAFVDTPGIHRPLHRLNVRMVDAAVDTFREVDVIALVFDASTRPGQGDEYVSRLLTDVLARQPGVSLYDDLGTPWKLNLTTRGFSVGPTVGIPPGISVFVDGVRQNEIESSHVVSRRIWRAPVMIHRGGGRTNAESTMRLRASSTRRSLR